MAYKRITFDLDEETAHKLKLRVVEKGTTQKQLLTDLILKELSEDVE